MAKLKWKFVTTEQAAQMCGEAITLAVAEAEKRTREELRKMALGFEARIAAVEVKRKSSKMP